MNMHLVPVSGDSQSPFDTIKNISPDTGNEYWSARDLAPLMGYATTDAWKNFEKAINRAWMSAKNQGHDTEHHFAVSSKVIEGGRWGKQTVKDFHFTRFAAYLVAMNGDPNKSEVAAAQAYFAIQTHVAETRPTAPALPQDYATALRELASTVEAKELAEKQAREQQKLAEQRARAIESQAPAVAKANAHTASKAAIGRQAFAREVQFWGSKRGLNINQESVFQLLRRKGMLISGQRKDRNHPTSQAVKNGWAEVEKGTTESGYSWAKPVIKPKGQDIAWKWILAAVDDFGQTLNPPKEIAS